MKRKSPRGIPDFAHHPERTKDPATPPTSAPVKAAGPRAASPPVRVKPQTTSAKSGRRGQ